MSAHITSFLILCQPQKRWAVSVAADALPGVEVHHCGEDGKIVAVAEGGTEAHICHVMECLQSLAGVVATNMVYHGVDAEETDAS